MEHLCSDRMKNLLNSMQVQISTMKDSPVRVTKRPSLKSVCSTLCADLNINRLNEMRFNKTIASDAGVGAVH